MIKHISVLLCIFISNLCFTQDKTAEIDSIIKATYALNPDIGISVGFVYDKDQHFFNYGNVNRTGIQKVDSQTSFEIGSITKLLTSYLIIQQVEAGKINLDSVIDNYLPSKIILNSAIKNKIRVSDLASHQSGLPDFNFEHLMMINPMQPLDEVTKEMVDSILTNTSDLNSLGSYKYSNISYVLLGSILENVCNDSYENILQKNLLTPFKMNKTLTSAFNGNNQSSGHNAKNEQMVFFNWNSIIGPAGLLKSNSVDMLKFVIELLNDDNESISHKLTNTYFKNTFIELGIGLNILKENGNIIYAKTGDTLGQSSVLAFNPEKKWGVIILTNQANSTARLLFSEIKKILK